MKKNLKTFNSKIITVKNGNIFKVLNKKSNFFRGFGELYFSEIKYNKIKGWKLHKKMDMTLVVPYGLVKFVFSIDKKKPYKEILLGSKKNYYKILSVPPNIWFGFKGCSKPKSIVCNISNILYDSKEVLSCDLNEIPFNW